MDYAKEQEYLQRLSDEVDTDVKPDDDDASLTSDNEEIQNYDTVDDQTIETIDDLNILLTNEQTGQQLAALYTGKD